MKNTIYSIIIILALVLITNSLNAMQISDLRKEGHYYVATIEQNFEVKPGGKLLMEKVNGDISITSWNKNEVHIREIRKMDVFTKGEAETALEKANVGYRQEGNTVIIGGASYYRDWMQSTFTIQVPAKFSLDVSTQGGDIDVNSIEGEIKLATSGGDIDLADITGNADVKTSGGDLSLKKINGELVAKTSGGDIDASDISASASVATSGGDIELTGIKGAVKATTSGGDIDVRQCDSEVSLNTSGGDITVSGVGAGLHASTSGGDIDVRQVKGEISLNTSGGDIQVSGTGGPLTVNTSGGDIEAQNIQIGAKANTAGGDIELGDVKGFIEANTAGGDIEGQITLEDFSKDHHATMNTAGGDLTLTIPANMPASIRAKIKIRDGGWEDYNIYSDFPIKIESDSSTDEDKSWRRREGEIQASGDINGGGDLLQLETVNGNIYIKKLNLK